ncbi:diaminobutyrate--2-oxoglutarate transaminase [Hyphomicrobium sp.]|uniref:diaminobutyrate--2-oxoglutarate transaminase n=1 Tax=Hyphomicrobium sp. TaxID=82 RepID=UPI0025B90EE6|nr:diaminobutyrate--2-oxoglutarate transaminase [Hyphomicrobium sp.]MCC7253544.1 diaminobutyrate--2-oxoglutarate transaminase [Hyphomicrobium sp.]
MNVHPSPIVRHFDPFSIESNVRSYCRRMASTFRRALNAEVWDDEGRRYIDFLSACGALNYGHNHPALKAELLKYICGDGIATSMDLHTSAKRAFLAKFFGTVLLPRRLDYVIQFPGPTGTNAVEAALKLARKVTKRRDVVAFTNAFHGMSLGALAATGSRFARGGAGVPLSHVHRLPFACAGNDGVKVLHDYRDAVCDPSSGIEAPAAFIVETVQGEGGLTVAPYEWLRALESVARDLGALVIVDDVQAGCGRTGPFFSFERANIFPDIVCLAKSISGFGLPMAVVLIKPQFDRWRPAEHNGTFRGNNHAFVTATAALGLWENKKFQSDITTREQELWNWVDGIAADYPRFLEARGIGMMQGLRFADPHIAVEVADRAVRNGLLIELCGPHDEVLKLLPPLTIEQEVLEEGLYRLQDAIRACLSPARMGYRRYRLRRSEGSSRKRET